MFAPDENVQAVIVTANGAQAECGSPAKQSHKKNKYGFELSFLKIFILLQPNKIEHFAY